MHFKGTDLNLLVALEALLMEKSVTLAAERVHVTQPAMSNALRRIRERFEDDILVRNGRSFELTPAAQAMIAPLQEILSQTDALIGTSSAFDPMTARKTFRLMMSDYCADILLPLVANSLNKFAPHIKCEVDFLNNKALYRLWSGDVDFCVTPQDLRLIDPSFKAGSFERADLFRDSFVCLISPDNPAVDRGLTVEAYRSSSHVCVRFGDGTISMDEQVKKQWGLDTKMVVPSVGNLPKVVRGTNLIATVPARLAASLDPGSGLMQFHCPLDIPEFLETLLWHPKSDHDPGHRWFREMLVQAAQQLPEVDQMPARERRTATA